MNCRQFRRQYVGLFDLEPNQETQRHLMGHLETCPQCAREFNELRETLETLEPSRRVTASPQFKETVMNRIVRLSSETVDTRRSADRRPLWKSAFAVGVAAALVMAAVVAVWVKPSGRVYAIEQTIEAYRGVRSIHMKMTPPTFGSVGEIWAQFDENGDLERLRMNFPDTEDGPKDVLWGNGKAEVLFKAKGSVLVVNEENLLEKIRVGYDFFDPRLLVESLYQRLSDDTVNIEIQGSPIGDAPITITVTAEGVPDRQDVYTVDPKTKLVRHHDVYRRHNGALELTGSTEYLEYNQPVDPAVFVLDAPPDGMRIDQTTQEVGLLQGDLSDKEIAVEVVRQFFEALIAKDYAKAGQLMEGKSEELLGRLNVVRIVSIGEPTPYAASQSLKVPCKVEIESGGKTSVFEPFGPFVRQVYNQPNRWTICGGI